MSGTLAHLYDAATLFTMAFTACNCSAFVPPNDLCPITWRSQHCKQSVTGTLTTDERLSTFRIELAVEPAKVKVVGGEYIGLLTPLLTGRIVGFLLQASLSVPARIGVP